MYLRKNIIIVLGLIISAVIFGAFMPQQQGPAQGGPPQNQEPPKNLKVLPKNIARAELDSIMRSFRTALGVRCNFCHAAAPGTPPRMDYASDEKPEKIKARQMMKMMMDINKKYFNKKASITSNALAVTCAGCHNGKQKPVTSM
jgi:hypothetical protein